MVAAVTIYRTVGKTFNGEQRSKAEGPNGTGVIGRIITGLV